MNYKCDICDCSFRDKFNYTKHLDTKKHKDNDSNHTQSKNINVEKTCVYCFQKFSNSSALSRHKHTCSEKQSLIAKHNFEINCLKNEVEEKNKLLKYKDETIDMLKDQLTFIKTQYSL